MSQEHELAYRYDLIVVPLWREPLDALLDDTVQHADRGRFLEVNCGTGDGAIGTAVRIGVQGSVMAIDPSRERIAIARAKATVKKLSNLTFEPVAEEELPFRDEEFDTVIADLSLTPTSQIPGLLKEIVRVARDGARVAVKLSTRGTFDEFFSLYWETLLKLGIVEELWQNLENLIKERLTVSEAEDLVRASGLKRSESLSRREVLSFASGAEFIDSPLIADIFLGAWLAFVPPTVVDDVRAALIELIERERQGLPFEVSLKATVVTGIR